MEASHESPSDAVPPANMNSNDGSPSRTKDGEFRLKLLKEREKQEHARKVAELKLAEERDERLRQQKEEERQKRIQEQRQREDLRRQGVLERRRKQDEEMEQRRREIEAKFLAADRVLEAKRSEKPSYAFGSSAPRTLAYLENLDPTQRLLTNKLRSSGAGNDSVLSETGDVVGAASACSATSTSDVNSPEHRSKSSSLSQRRPLVPPNRSTLRSAPASSGFNATSMTASYCVGQSQPHGMHNVRQKAASRLSPPSNAKTAPTMLSARSVREIPKKVMTPNSTSVMTRSTYASSSRALDHSSSPSVGRPPTARGLVSAQPMRVPRDASSSRASTTARQGAGITLQNRDGDTFKKPLPPKIASTTRQPVAAASAAKPVGGAPKRPGALNVAAGATPTGIKGRSASQTPTPAPISAPTTPGMGTTSSAGPVSGFVSSATVNSESMIDGMLSSANTNVSTVAAASISPVPPQRELVQNNEQVVCIGGTVENNASEGERSESPSSDVNKAFSAQRNRTEEEAKAALAEKRRLAREEQERQRKLQEAEEERKRLEEEERILREEEEFRRQEEEAMRIDAERKHAEEERLQKAIEEARKQREEEQRREDEERQKKEEMERHLREQREKLEKERLEREEKLRRHQEERLERSKKIEALRNKTRQSAVSKPDASVMSASMIVTPQDMMTFNSPAPAVSPAMSRSMIDDFSDLGVPSVSITSSTPIRHHDAALSQIMNNNNSGMNGHHSDDDLQKSNNKETIAAFQNGTLHSDANEKTLFLRSSDFHTPTGGGSGRPSDTSSMIRNDASFMSTVSHQSEMMSTTIQNNSTVYDSCLLDDSNSSGDISLISNNLCAMTINDSFNAAVDSCSTPVPLASTSPLLASSDGTGGVDTTLDAHDSRVSMSTSQQPLVDRHNVEAAASQPLLDFSDNFKSDVPAVMVTDGGGLRHFNGNNNNNNTSETMQVLSSPIGDLNPVISSVSTAFLPTTRDYPSRDPNGNVANGVLSVKPPLSCYLVPDSVDSLTP